jgi:lipoprotein NlpI
MADYDRALSLNPTMAAVYQNRGIAYLLHGQDAEAERDFTRCLELDSSLKPSLDKAVAAIKKRR